MFKEGRERSDYPKIFMSHKIEVRESSIHGWGIFAKERIDANELIESAPVILFHKDTCEALGYGSRRDVSIDTSGGLRIDGVHDRHVLMDYPFEWKDKMLAFGLGYSGVYNHSTEGPSALWRPNFEYECIEIYTRRVIDPDEEITIRYVAYKHCGTLWFTSDEPNRKLDDPLEPDANEWRHMPTEIKRFDK